MQLKLPLRDLVTIACAGGLVGKRVEVYNTDLVRVATGHQFARGVIECVRFRRSAPEQAIIRLVGYDLWFQITQIATISAE